MFEHILMPVDKATLAPTFYHQLEHMFGGMHPKITLVHISDPMLPMFYSDAIMGANYQSQKEHLKAVNAYAEHVFTSIKQQLSSRFATDTLHILDEDTANGILTAIKKSRADLVLMTPHRDAGFMDRLIGTKTYSVMMRTKVPVLAI